MAQHKDKALFLLKKYAQSYISLLSPKHWQVILEFLEKYIVIEKNIVIIHESLVNDEIVNTAIKDFERLIVFFEADKYLLNAIYEGDLSYDLDTSDKEMYEKWELTNQGSVDYFAKLIASTEESRKINKVLNIKSLENTFSERLRHNFYPMSKSMVDEWIDKRLRYESYLNAEYAIRQVSQFILDDENSFKS